jgi:hypothetical protein
MGVLVFVGVPEAARWIDSGPVAQAQNALELRVSPPSGNCNNNGTNNGTINNNCPTINQGVPRRPAGLYQSDQMIGLVDAFKLNGGKITFTNPRISSGIVDLEANMEFQDLVISCPGFASVTSGRRAAQTTIMVNGAMDCDVVRNRQ